jgi:hypothetical protein
VQLCQKAESSTPKNMALWGVATLSPDTRLVQQTRDRGPSIHGVAELRSVPSGYSPTIASVAAVMAGSQVVVAQPCGALPSLPAGFNYADIAVLDWIAADARRQARRRPPM